MPRRGKGCTRVRMMMLLHCCSTQGQLRLTCTFSAECAQAEGCGSGCMDTPCGREGSEGSKGSEGSEGKVSPSAMSFIFRLAKWKTKQLPCGRKKQANRASPDGNAPLSPPTAVLLLKGSMSLDSQSSTTPYESSSFATPEGEVFLPLYIEQLKLALRDK